MMSSKCILVELTLWLLEAHLQVDLCVCVCVKGKKAWDEKIASLLGAESSPRLSTVFSVWSGYVAGVSDTSESNTYNTPLLISV